MAEEEFEEYLREQEVEELEEAEANVSDEELKQIEEEIAAEEEEAQRELEERTKKRQLFREQRRPTLEQYKTEWQRIYGVEPRLPERAKAFREAELRRLGGPEKIRAQRAAVLAERVKAREKLRETKAAEQIQRTFRKYRSIPCENAAFMERHLSPLQSIKLRIVKDKIIHHVCYDIIELYLYLTDTYKYSKDWKDPTHNVLYTDFQINLINNKYKLANVCNVPKVHEKMFAFRSDQVAVSRNLYDRLSDIAGSRRFILRISDLGYDFAKSSRRTYTYIVVDNFHTSDDNVLYLPYDVMRQLNLKEGDAVLVDDCFTLPKVNYILLKPETKEWFSLSVDLIEDVKSKLTEALETYDVLEQGQLISIDIGDRTYVLQIVDLRDLNNRRLTAGNPKFAEVKVEFTER